MPTIITTPMSDMTLSVVPVSEERNDHAGQAGRHGEQDEQRIDERFELRDEDEIKQDQREKQAEAEAAERIVHRLRPCRAASTRTSPAGWLRSTIFCTPVRDRAEILRRRSDVDVDDAPELVVIHLGRRLERRDVATTSSVRRLSVRAGMERNGAQIAQVLNVAFGILHGQHVVVAALRIDPVARRDHAVGRQRGDDVVDDFALR